VNRRRGARIVFGIGFMVLLLDGAAAIWLGQVSGRVLLVVVGLMLIAAAVGLSVAYRKWMAALDEVHAARADLKAEVGRLRAAAAAARGDRPSPN
jgi:disulfide bond formation protein DsbB